MRPIRSSLDLGRRIRDRRLQLTLTQAQLADRAGLTQPAISRVERGLGLGSLDQLLHLLRALDLELTTQIADRNIPKAPWDDP